MKYESAGVPQQNSALLPDSRPPAPGHCTIIIPASTSNLGASFDTCGLALSLYLKVGVEEARGFRVEARGEGSEAMPRDESNLILRVARFVSERRGRRLGGARLFVDNQIPLARGLGSSSAAIIAGVSVYEVLANDRLSDEEFFACALNFEGHGDNLAPSRLGGLVVACVTGEGEGRSLVAVRREWPEQVKIVLAVPDFEMETAKMRAVLPASVPRDDAIFNIQRAALLQAAISEGRFDLLREALRDRLHQPYRSPLAPGLGDVLRLNDETHLHEGLLGVAISGAGSTMIAFASKNRGEIAALMRERLARAGAHARTFEVEVDNLGRRFEAAPSGN
ncbi:MAG TPA: homoserine kinase [Blastocatellia bacterium]|nr:homoserine kinase [Blastocatellia bacterium]